MKYFHPIFLDQMEPIFLVIAIFFLLTLLLYLWADATVSDIEDDIKALIDQWDKGPKSDENA